MIFPIGPYIYYAESDLSESEIQRKKEQFGKTLLFFPSHSIDRATTEYDIRELIGRILELKAEHSFQTVIVCLYYRDVELGRTEMYRAAGFLTACCGRREDQAFLRRQKSLILLADYTASNSVGTHIGYAVILGKPHLLLDMKVEFQIESREDARKITDLYLSDTVREKENVGKAFSVYTDTITEEQRRVCNRYWGNNLVLTPREIKTVLTACETVFQKASKKEPFFEKCAEDYLYSISETAVGLSEEAR